jgi:hypothetical protein
MDGRWDRCLGHVRGTAGEDDIARSLPVMVASSADGQPGPWRPAASLANRECGAADPTVIGQALLLIVASVSPHRLMIYMCIGKGWWRSNSDSRAAVAPRILQGSIWVVCFRRQGERISLHVGRGIVVWTERQKRELDRCRPPASAHCKRRRLCRVVALAFLFHPA